MKEKNSDLTAEITKNTKIFDRMTGFTGWELSHAKICHASFPKHCV
jgi:hypothetical protein